MSRKYQTLIILVLFPFSPEPLFLDVLQENVNVSKYELIPFPTFTNKAGDPQRTNHWLKNLDGHNDIGQRDT